MTDCTVSPISSPKTSPLPVFGVVGIDTLHTQAGSAARQLGGSAPYAALGARYFYPQVCLSGVAGDDFPQAFIDCIRGCGIDTAGLEIQEGTTFAWEAEYAKDMNNRRTLRTDLGVLATWQPKLSADLRGGRYILCTNVTPALQLSMLEQCDPSAFVLSDFMESWIRSARDQVESVIAHSSLVLMNQDEACVFAGGLDPFAAAEKVFDLGAEAFVLKQGSAGSTLLHRNGGRIFRCPSWPLRQAIDPTGAGDSFMGALGGWLASACPDGKPSFKELQCGVAAGAVVGAVACESFGVAALSQTPCEEIFRRLRQFADMTRWTFADKWSI